MKFTLDYTNMTARQLRFKGNLHEFWLGMNAESEHGNFNSRTDITFKNTILTAKDPRTNIKSNETILAAKITVAHLNKQPDYYSHLLKTETK